MAKTKERGSVKRTYTLSAATSDQFESLVPAGQRSHVIEGLLQRELEEMRRQRLRDLVAQGLAEMADVNAELVNAWTDSETERWPTE
jgi:hypothetical protein